MCTWHWLASYSSGGKQKSLRMLFIWERFFWGGMALNWIRLLLCLLSFSPVHDYGSSQQWGTSDEEARHGPLGFSDPRDSCKPCPLPRPPSLLRPGLRGSCSALAQVLLEGGMCPLIVTVLRTCMDRKKCVFVETTDISAGLEGSLLYRGKSHIHCTAYFAFGSNHCTACCPRRLCMKWLIEKSSPPLGF